MIVHRSNFLLENTLSSLYCFNSSLQNHDEIVILHYSSLNLLTFIITFVSSICWIVLVWINLFCASSSMGWMSLFDKFKLVCIFSTMCWTYGIFVRPWVGRCSNPLPKVFILSYIWTSIPCNEGHTGVSSLSSREFSRPWSGRFEQKFKQE